MITDLELDKIRTIFFYVAPKLLRSIQDYQSDQEFRTGVIVGLPSNKRGFYDTLYINIENITPWQLKTFDRRSKKDLPSRAYIEQHGQITRLGFKKSV